MNKQPSRAAVPPTFFAKVALPFAVPIMLAMALLLAVGERWPRSMAPGSGLKLAGLCATAITCALAWRFAVRGIEDSRVHKFSAVLCTATGLLGWPIWTMGILPSINGYALGGERTAIMALDRLETTRQSKSDRINHWAWLRASDTAAPIDSGRYYIPEHVHADWNRRRPATIRVTMARGLLGAWVVIGFERAGFTTRKA